MLSDSQHLQSLIPLLDIAVNTTSQAGMVVSSNLNNTAALEQTLDTSVSNYLDVVIGYMDQFIDIAIKQVSLSLSCLPHYPRSG